MRNGNRHCNTGHNTHCTHDIGSGHSDPGDDLIGQKPGEGHEGHEDQVTVREDLNMEYLLKVNTTPIEHSPFTYRREQRNNAEVKDIRIGLAQDQLVSTLRSIIFKQKLVTVGDEDQCANGNDDEVDVQGLFQFQHQGRKENTENTAGTPETVKGTHDLLVKTLLKGDGLCVYGDIENSGGKGE
jgi:hypothetical protein